MVMVRPLIQLENRHAIFEVMPRHQASGLELEARAPLDVLGLPQLTLWSNATAVHTRLKSEATGETRRFLDQPDYLFNAGADYYLASLRTTFGVNYNWNSGYNQKYRLSSGKTAEADQDAVGRVDISARTQLSENTSLNLSVLNLFAQNEDSCSSSWTACLPAAPRPTAPMACWTATA